jgi:acetyl esterase/lipase
MSCHAEGEMHNRFAYGLWAAAMLLFIGIPVSQAVATSPGERSRPGEILSLEAIAGAPMGGTAYRVRYRSIGLNGEPITVSGIVVVPSGPAPQRERDVIAWAHPTTGVMARCAPSNWPGVFTTIPGLDLMLARGFVVAATDYPGLGTAGPHPYLVGISEGHAVLDSVRAARAVAGANTSNRFAVWGHSQGGHAALFAGQLSESYAPDLRLIGVAAAAPATELTSLFDADIATPNGKILTAMTLWSWSRVYGTPLDAVVNSEALTVVDRIANDCIESLVDIVTVRFGERPLEKAFLKVEDLTTVQPWGRLMEENTPAGPPRGVPVFLAQGTADSVVLPAVTEKFMSRLCARGARVQLLRMSGGIHAFAARHSAAAAVTWMTERFDGSPAPDECGR